MKGLDWPVIGYFCRKRSPCEAFELWDRLYPGFGSPCRDLLAADVTPKAKQAIHRTMARMLTRKRDRLLLKVTGWPRVGFLKEVFPDAKFIHVLRDGRAVVNSLLSVNWWQGWQGPENWCWGQLTPAQRKEWRKQDESFVALAGIEWKILLGAMDKAKSEAGAEQFLEVKYEDLCADPVGVFRQVTGFCGLESSAWFEHFVAGHSWKNTNYKWRDEFTPQQQQVLQDVIGDELKRRGYE